MDRRKRKNMFIFIFIFILLFCLTFGQAYLNSSLVINGKTNINKNVWDVHLDNINIISGSVEATIEPVVNGNSMEIDFEATLSKPGDFYEFTVDVVNLGTIDAMISNIEKEPELTEEQAKYLEYIIEYENGGSIDVKHLVRTNSFLRIRIKISYKKDITIDDLPSVSSSLSLGFILNLEQSDDNATDVVTGGFLQDDIVQSGGVYYVGVTNSSFNDYSTAQETYVEEETMPMTIKDGDVYIYGNYEYRYNRYNASTYWAKNSKAVDGWGVRCINNVADPGPILESINGAPVLIAQYAFYNCTNLTTAPILPDGIINITYLFRKCSSLKTYAGSVDPDGDFSNYPIPSGVTIFSNVFNGCSNLVVAPKIPKNVTTISGAFKDCNKLLSVYYPCSISSTTVPNDFPSSVNTAMYHYEGCGH